MRAPEEYKWHQDLWAQLHRYVFLCLLGIRKISSFLTLINRLVLLCFIFWFSIHNFASIFLILWKNKLTGFHSASQVPTLIAWGEKDPWEPVALGRAYGQFDTVEDFIVFPNVGHCPQVRSLQQLLILLRPSASLYWVLFQKCVEI